MLNEKEKKEFKNSQKSFNNQNSVPDGLIRHGESTLNAVIKITKYVTGFKYWNI